MIVDIISDSMAQRKSYTSCQATEKVLQLLDEDPPVNDNDPDYVPELMYDDCGSDNEESDIDMNIDQSYEPATTKEESEKGNEPEFEDIPGNSVASEEGASDHTAQEEQKYYRLQHQGTTLMKALFIGSSRKETIQGNHLKKGYAKYKIVNLYLNAVLKSSYAYDPSIHSPGEIITWPMRNAKAIKYGKKRSNDGISRKSNSNEEEGTHGGVENEKKMLPPCECRAKCSTKITEEDRKVIHRRYWDSSYKERRTWLLQSISEEGVKRRKIKEDSSRRNHSRKYLLNDVPVCKSMFMNTLGYLYDKFITVALKGYVAEDRRGSHNHDYHSIADDERKFIEDHINAFEPGISHYRRSHAPHRIYIDPSLSIAELYRSYKSKCQVENRKCSSLSTYTRIVHSMNISFAKLGHEECEVCLKYDQHPCDGDRIEMRCDCCSKAVSDKEECLCCKEFNRMLALKPQQYASTEHNCECCKQHQSFIDRKNEAKATCTGCESQKRHLKRDNEARAEYRADRAKSEENQDEFLFASLDLQKVRMIPEIPGVKSAVFTRRICAYNETFSPLGEGKLHDSVAVIWHQGIYFRLIFYPQFLF